MLKPGTAGFGAVPCIRRSYAARIGALSRRSRFLGHGIGQTIHEEPYITDTRDIVLERNITFTMEPLYMMPG